MASLTEKGTNYAGPLRTAGGVVFTATHGTPTDSTLRALYAKTDGNAYWWNGYSEIRVNLSGGSGSSSGLDTSYSLGENTITIDEGAITLADATTGALNTLVLNKILQFLQWM